MLHSHAIDLEALCIIPGQKCWVLYIDALVLDSAGSLLDAISLCTKAALSDTVTPAVTVVQGDGPDDKDIDVSDDPFECKPFTHDDVGLCVSLTKVGPAFIADASLEEEQCMAMRITTTVTKDGRVGGVHKDGAVNSPKL
jgi:exosome complex component RRP42